MTGLKQLEHVRNTTVLVPVLLTQYTIVNSAFMNTCFEAHTLHMQESTRYTTQLTAVQDTVILKLTT